MTARAALEVADLLRTHGAAFQQQYGERLTTAQRRALRDLVACRTAALGGHVERCADCGQERIAYNSCRNRHCPKCQATARARWLQREASYLLPVEYFHVVFTLPQPLAALALANPHTVYGLLFRTAWATVQELAADPHYLGAQVGLLAVLHTWGQRLDLHPHLHCVVTGGGLSCNAAGVVEASPRWVSCRPGFFLPVRVLSRLFRGKFLAGLQQAYAAGQLGLGGSLAALTEAAAWRAWLQPLYAVDWVVYAKPPFGGPEQVLKYLARYTHRVAISNQRLESLADGQVTFRYKAYAEGHRPRRLTLTAEEFVRRWLQHVLPRGLVKVRHYGLLASRRREARLAVSRSLLALQGLVLAVVAAQRPAAETTPCCAGCGSPRLVRVQELPRAGERPGVVTADTS
jgi:Putative transposase/Transposase zinc-binding domain